MYLLSSRSSSSFTCTFISKQNRPFAQGLLSATLWNNITQNALKKFKSRYANDARSFPKLLQFNSAQKHLFHITEE